LAEVNMPKFAKIIVIITIFTGAFFLFYLTDDSEPYVENVIPPAKPVPEQTALFFAGDIMLSRNVAKESYGANDMTLPFQKIADKVKSADISFANLEFPFLDKGPYAQQGLVFKAEPKAIEGLTYAGFDVVSTANNHAMDQGIKGLEFTIDLLTQNNILPSGTKKTNQNEPTAAIEKNGIVFGFLSYSYTALNDGGKSKNSQINDFNDVEGMAQDVVAIKGHTADVVIVSMHAGTEYQRNPNQSQINFARAAIDAGADLVIGHHPHWVQTIEMYKDKPIFYSLGNFVFDQMWSQDTKEGLTVTITFNDNQITKIELQPVIIEDYCCPRWANENETAVIIKKIGLSNTVLFQK